MEGWKLPIQVWETHQRSQQNLGLNSRSLEKRRWWVERGKKGKRKNIFSKANIIRHEGPFLFLTLSDEQAVTLEAAMMKSRINMVAPGRPILKNLGLQCFMMVFTMSCRKKCKALLNTL